MQWFSTLTIEKVSDLVNAPNNDINSSQDDFETLLP
jgi:hypothetical protein